MNEKFEAYTLAAYGLARGVFNVYVRPLPGDLIHWAVRGLLEFDMPTQESIDELIAEVAAEEL